MPNIIANLDPEGNWITRYISAEGTIYEVRPYSGEGINFWCLDRHQDYSIYSFCSGERDWFHVGFIECFGRYFNALGFILNAYRDRKTLEESLADLHMIVGRELYRAQSNRSF